MQNLSTARWAGRVAGATLALLLVGGCSDASQQDAATIAAEFVAAAPEAACRRLAPATAEALESAGTPCPEALAEVVGHADSPVRAEVAGGSAQVRFPDQVVFLARFPQGWLVTAAGCVHEGPDRAKPYECEVQP